MFDFGIGARLQDHHLVAVLQRVDPFQRLGAGLLEARRDDRVQPGIHALDAGDRGLDQLPRARVAAPHQLRLCRRVESGQIVRHRANVVDRRGRSPGVDTARHASNREPW